MAPEDYCQCYFLDFRSLYIQFKRRLVNQFISSLDYQKATGPLPRSSDGFPSGVLRFGSIVDRRLAATLNQSGRYTHVEYVRNAARDKVMLGRCSVVSHGRRPVCMILSLVGGSLTM